MRSNDRRTRQILCRAAQLRRQSRRRRRRAAGLACAAACLALVVGFSLRIGQSFSGFGGGPQAPGTAALTGSGAQSGYVVTGVLAFFLGAAVTVFLYRLRRYGGKEKEREDSGHDMEC